MHYRIGWLGIRCHTSMSESDEGRQSKRPRLSHVTLAEDAEVDGGLERMIVVGRRVHEAVAEKCGLLSGLAQADGLASLPSNLSPEDVQRWHIARLLDAVPSTDDLVTILKVRSPGRIADHIADHIPHPL